MPFACWITKGTDTHLKYVILLAFLRQPWLRERSSVLRLYVHFLSRYNWRSVSNDIIFLLSWHQWNASSLTQCWKTSCKYIPFINFVCFSVHNHNKQINHVGLLEALSTLIFTIWSGALDILLSPYITKPSVLGDRGARVGFNRQYPSVHFITDIPLVERGGWYFVSIIFHSFHHVNTATVTPGWGWCCIGGVERRGFSFDCTA
jgi:hypothetical protein